MLEATGPPLVALRPSLQEPTHRPLCGGVAFLPSSADFVPLVSGAVVVLKVRKCFVLAVFTVRVAVSPFQSSLGRNFLSAWWCFEGPLAHGR